MIDPVALAPKLEARYQRNLFFFFGLAILAIAARTPDLKSDLHVNDGTYGVLVSLGAVGAMFSFFTVGQLVHKIGVKPVVLVTGSLTFATIAMIPHIHSPLIYVLINMILGFAFNAYNIAIHDQALKRQADSGELILPRLHGVWSIGALLTVAIAVAVTAHVSFAWHIDTLMFICWMGTVYSTIRLTPVLIKGSSQHDPNSSIKVKALWHMFLDDKLIGIAYLCAVMVEISTNDWATLVAHQEIKASTTLSILPYLLFMVGMIAGRLIVHRLVKIRSEDFWIKRFTSMGGIGFILLLQSAKALVPHSFALSFTCEALGFLIGGLGGSFMAGTITQIASRRSSLPGGVVVAQLGIIITIFSLLVKLVISWVVDSSSITTALIIPGIMMVAVAFFPNLGSKQIQGS